MLIIFHCTRPVKYRYDSIKNLDMFILGTVFFYFNGRIYLRVDRGRWSGFSFCSRFLFSN